MFLHLNLSGSGSRALCCALLLVFPLFGFCLPQQTETSDSLISYPNIKDSDHIFSRYQYYLNRKINDNARRIKSDIYDRVQKNMDTSGLREKFNQTQTVMLTMSRGLREMEASTTGYYIHYVPGILALHGATTGNISTGEIIIAFGEGTPDTAEVITHELRHAIQYEHGEVSEGLNGPREESLYDLTDEVDAYWYARVTTYSIDDGIPVTKHWVRKNFKEYVHLRRRKISLNSRIGRALRRRTRERGSEHAPVREFYKGWEKDYAEGATP